MEEAVPIPPIWPVTLAPVPSFLAPRSPALIAKSTLNVTFPRVKTVETVPIHQIYPPTVVLARSITPDLTVKSQRNVTHLHA